MSTITYPLAGRTPAAGEVFDARLADLDRVISALEQLIHPWVTPPAIAASATVHLGALRLVRSELARASAATPEAPATLDAASMLAAVNKANAWFTAMSQAPETPREAANDWVAEATADALALSGVAGLLIGLQGVATREAAATTPTA